MAEKTSVKEAVKIERIVKITCCSHIGKRQNHEDNYLVNGEYLTSSVQEKMTDKRIVLLETSSAKKIQYFALSDGMGGHNAGEIASRICMEQLAALENRVEKCNSLRETVSLFQFAIANINKYICEISGRQKDCEGMGATLVLFIIYKDEYAVLNIGDSRAYLLDKKGVVQLTKDHTEGQRMLDLGLLTQKEVESFSARKNLSRYIGYMQEGFLLKADEYYPRIDDGIVILCSDGITDAVDIMKTLSYEKCKMNLLQSNKKITEQAVASSEYADNATAVFISIKGGGAVWHRKI